MMGGAGGRPPGRGRRLATLRHPGEVRPRPNCAVDGGVAGAPLLVAHAAGGPVVCAGGVLIAAAGGLALAPSCPATPRRTFWELSVHRGRVQHAGVAVAAGVTSRPTGGARRLRWRGPPVVLVAWCRGRCRLFGCPTWLRADLRRSPIRRYRRSVRRHWLPLTVNQCARVAGPWSASCGGRPGMWG